jgi:pimeloyl-ACP methyl ester carboxylesterase
MATHYVDQARHHEKKGRPEAIDLYYRAAVIAYACLSQPGLAGGSAFEQEAIAIYNRSLAGCLSAAVPRGRLVARSHLIVTTPSGPAAIPIARQGFVWQTADFMSLVDPAKIPADKKQERCRVRAGIGAVRVGMRFSRVEHHEDFLPRTATFPVTAMLYPDLDAWFGRRAGGLPQDCLALYDPLRIGAVPVGDRHLRLAADLDAPLAVLNQLMRPDQFRVDGFLRPDTMITRAGIAMLEPYQPGKIPLVLIHGLASTPWTFTDMIGDLRSDPRILERYQIWVFAYPTGAGFLRMAKTLRQQLSQIVAQHDPQGTDPALREMVLVGHSMGGLLSKIQTLYSGDAVWDTIATMPIETVQTTTETRELFREMCYFEPQPYVRRVVLIASPHRGSHIADAFLGRLASSFVKQSDERREMFTQLKRDNPGIFRDGFQRMWTSVDLLEYDHPLLVTLLRLPRSSEVTYHSIIGVAKTKPISGEVSDGVVPVASAKLPDVASELYLEETHGTIQHDLKTTQEVKRILELHLAALGSGGTLADTVIVPPSDEEMVTDPVVPAAADPALDEPEEVDAKPPTAPVESLPPEPLAVPVER